MKSLPSSLRETYSRIFERIEKSAAGDVKRFLTWLCFAKQPITLSAMNRILAIRTDGDVKYDDSRCYIDTWDIVNVCPGLFSVDTDESHLEIVSAYENEPSEPPDQRRNSLDSQAEFTSVVRIAHFSVFEYLLSDPALDFSAGEYHFQAAAAHSEIVKCCVILLSEIAPSYEDGEDGGFSFSITSYCARFWAQHLKDSAEPQDTRKMAIDFLSSRNTYESWRRVLDIPNGDYVTKGIFRHGIFGSPGFYVARLGLA